MGGNSSFYVVRYKDCNKLEWNSFAELSDEGWFWYTPLFLEVWSHGENISFCIKDKFGNIVLEQVLFFSGNVKENGHLFYRYTCKEIFQWNVRKISFCCISKS